MPRFPNDDISAIRERLLDGIRSYREAAGNDCGYTEEDIDRCTIIVDAYLATVAKGLKVSQQDIRDAVTKIVTDLNALNEKCECALIETDQREDLCELILVAAKAAGLDTDEDDITEGREW